MKAAILAPRQLERFQLQCHGCSVQVEIRADLVFDGWAICPSRECGTPLLIRWSALKKVSK